jgi:hypothetical protein
MASYIGRRKFLAALGGAAAWPLAAGAQQAAVPAVGMLSAEWPNLFSDRAADHENAIDRLISWASPSPVPRSPQLCSADQRSRTSCWSVWSNKQS